MDKDNFLPENFYDPTLKVGRDRSGYVLKDEKKYQQEIAEDILQVVKKMKVNGFTHIEGVTIGLAGTDNQKEQDIIHIKDKFLKKIEIDSIIQNLTLKTEFIYDQSEIPHEIIKVGFDCYLEELKKYLENVLLSKDNDIDSNLYITKKNDDFYHKGQLLKLSKRTDCYLTFCSLFSLIKHGGEVRY